MCFPLCVSTLGGEREEANGPAPGHWIECTVHQQMGTGAAGGSPAQEVPGLGSDLRAQGEFWGTAGPWPLLPLELCLPRGLEDALLYP